MLDIPYFWDITHIIYISNTSQQQHLKPYQQQIVPVVASNAHTLVLLAYLLLVEILDGLVQVPIGVEKMNSYDLIMRIIQFYRIIIHLFV